MLIDRFPYQTLSRKTIDGCRKYACPDGNNIPSVTTILAETKEAESKEALNNWRKRVGHAKAAEITAESAGRGTRMHSYLENYVNSGQTGEPGTNPYSVQSHSMANHIIDNFLGNVTTFYGSEVSLFFPKLYAGTTDLVAECDGELCICDYKQSNKPKKESWVEDYRCQLVAYAIAHNELYGTNIKRGIILMCTPPPELKFQKFEINENNFDHYEQIWWTKLEQYYSK